MLGCMGEAHTGKDLASLTDEQKAFQASKMAIHAAMVHCLRLAFGRVLDQVKSMRRWEDALGLYPSDNGARDEMMIRGDGHDPSLSPGAAGTFLSIGPDWAAAANTPFRRHKTWTHEGGLDAPPSPGRSIVTIFLKDTGVIHDSICWLHQRN